MAALIGWDAERTPPEMNPVTYLVPLLAYLVMAAAVAVLAVGLGFDTFVDGLVLGLVVGVGLSLMHTLVDASSIPDEPHPWVWFTVDGASHARPDHRRRDRLDLGVGTDFPAMRAFLAGAAGIIGRERVPKRSITRTAARSAVTVGAGERGRAPHRLRARSARRNALASSKPR